MLGCFFVLYFFLVGGVFRMVLTPCPWACLSVDNLPSQAHLVSHLSVAEIQTGSKRRTYQPPFLPLTWGSQQQRATLISPQTFTQTNKHNKPTKRCFYCKCITVSEVRWTWSLVETSGRPLQIDPRATFVVFVLFLSGATFSPSGWGAFWQPQAPKKLRDIDTQKKQTH